MKHSVIEKISEWLETNGIYNRVNGGTIATDGYSIYGGTEYYSTNDDWDNHDHIHIDNDGNANECHGQEPRDWEDRTKA